MSQEADATVTGRRPCIEAISRIGIGTAAFGNDYGIANKAGRVGPDEVFRILACGRDAGIDLLDTAFVYGDSESIIGQWSRDGQADFKIVSKLPPIDVFNADRLVEMLCQSLRRLNKERIYGYMVHRFSDFIEHEEMWRALEGLKQKRLVKKIGCSLYKPEELRILLDENVPLDIVQVPYSVFDRRFEPFFEELKGRGTEVHVRSVFLQGMVFLDSGKELAGKMRSIKVLLDNIRQTAEIINVSVGAICLNFALLNRYVDRVIIGVYSYEQMKNNIDYLLSMKDVELNLPLLDTLRTDDEDVLLPYNWRQ